LGLFVNENKLDIDRSDYKKCISAKIPPEKCQQMFKKFDTDALKMSNVDTK